MDKQKTEKAHALDDAYGVELDRRLALEKTLAAVWEVVETYESCGPRQQSTRDVLAAVRVALEGGSDASGGVPEQCAWCLANGLDPSAARHWAGQGVHLRSCPEVTTLPDGPPFCREPMPMMTRGDEEYCGLAAGHEGRCGNWMQPHQLAYYEAQARQR